MFSGTAGFYLTSISYLLLGKNGILKTEAKVARESTMGFFPLGITERLYYEKSSRRSSIIFIYALNLGFFD